MAQIAILRYSAMCSAIGRRMLTRRSKQIPVVRQLTPTDCGAAALAMVLRYHGKSVTLAEVRQSLGVGRNGSTAASLLDGGRLYGLRGRGVQADITDLYTLPPGTILHWEFNHFVVLQHVTPRGIRIVDPAIGWRNVPLDLCQRAFTGVALLFEPGDSFAPAASTSYHTLEVFRHITKSSGLVARLIAASVLIQVFSAIVPLLIGIVIDRVIPRHDYSLLVLLATVFAASQLFSAATTFIRTHLLIYFQTTLEASFTFRFLDHLVTLPYSFFQQRTAGDLMMRFASNTSIRDILTSTTLSTVMDGLMAGLYLIVMFNVSLTLTSIVIIAALLRIVLILGVRKRQRELLADNLAISARSQTYQVEMLSGMETLKAMGLEQRVAENWSNAFVDSLNVTIKRGGLDAMFSTGQQLLGMMSVFATTFYGAYLVLHGRFTLGMMVAFASLATAFMGPLNNLVASTVQFQMLETYLERIYDVIETPAEESSQRPLLTRKLSGAVVLRSVSFRYAKADPLTIDDISLSVKPGSRVALVGRTGSGKSTLARLLAGLYEPSAGSISFDGVDLHELNLRSVRSQLGIVTQESQLFGGTIRHNIGLADPDLHLNQIIRAAQLACIHEDIMAMPMGYETVLADRGLSLSGGQRQRLALARALVRRPALLILDEATSHLDALTEALITRNLASLCCTQVIIAHRLSTVRDADLIVVLRNGKKIDEGTHDGLLSTCAEYMALIYAQRE